MIAAATVWNALASQLKDNAVQWISVTSALRWQSPAATAMMRASTPYLEWLNATCAQAELAAAQAKAAAVAYDSAFAATVPPPVIAANRAQRTCLASTNFLGQAGATIADIDADYEEMWARDADAMYAYARASAEASTLTPWSPPPAPSNLAGPANPDNAARPSRSWAQRAAPEVISAATAVTSIIPEALAALSDPLTAFDVPLSEVTVPLSKLSSLSAPLDVALMNLNSLNKAALMNRASALRSLIPNLGRARRPARTADVSRGAPVGNLSVPRAWAMAANPTNTGAEPLDWGWVCGPVRIVHDGDPPMWPSCR